MFRFASSKDKTLKSENNLRREELASLGVVPERIQTTRPREKPRY